MKAEKLHLMLTLSVVISMITPSTPHFTVAVDACGYKECAKRIADLLGFSLRDCECATGLKIETFDIGSFEGGSLELKFAKLKLMMKQMCVKTFSIQLAHEVFRRTLIDVNDKTFETENEDEQSSKNGLPLPRKLNDAMIDRIFNDPKWSEMWYMNPKYEMARNMDVYGAWRKGYTGRGVVSTVIDDGIEYSNDDLSANYDAAASYDFNGSDNDPFPRITWDNLNKHGTRCAGQIAAVANNSICGIGVAYNSKVGGIRILDGRIFDSNEASALSYNFDHVDIYSASWGPRDNGLKVDGPGKLALAALEKAALEGRGGKGSIFVWAAGNGGRNADDCNCDGYVTSPYTIAVGSVSETGRAPPYSEPCASILTTTYSSGNRDLYQKCVISTDLRNGCTETHTGTSASAPMLAGIIALALEANPNLTWRDVQHLIVHSSFPDKIKESGWKINGAGHHFHDRFGFGLINANQMVTLAREWKNVPKRFSCAVYGLHNHQVVDPNNKLYGKMTTKACSKISHLEHVETIISLDTNKRGNIILILTSPQGTSSVLLHKRQNDASVSGFYKWPFMSTHFWGENPNGTWTLEIRNLNRDHKTYFTHWLLILHGY